MWSRTPTVVTSRSVDGWNYKHQLGLACSANQPAQCLIRPAHLHDGYLHLEFHDRPDRILQQVIAVEATQELEHCRRCLVMAMDELLSKLRAAHVRRMKL